MLLAGCPAGTLYHRLLVLMVTSQSPLQKTTDCVSVTELEDHFTRLGNTEETTAC